MATIVSLNRSNGGVPKLPVEEAWARAEGLEGDRQRDRRFHGGPQRALCLYSAERIEALRAEGHPIAPGTTGENVTVAGLDWDRVVPGVRLRLGAALVEVTSFTTPCKNIRGSFRHEEFTRMSQKLHPGWSRVYARVLEEGLLRSGDAADILAPR
ncbi:MAG: MOSC domain-containing protein [Gemmatimonadaceae bacterium]